MNFYLLHALTSDEVAPQKASRPFSKTRSGFVKSEGSASLLLESEKAVKERGAKPLAQVCGYGMTSDAYRITDGREDGLCVAKAMELAIQSAGLTIDDIDYINAHGTSTPLNDRVETAAIKRVFGERAYKIPVSSLKSQIGHSTVAAGGSESIACVSMLQKQMLAPTINYDEPDPECDLDYVPNVSRKADVNYILSNNLGFGGQNASLVFGKADL
jgi:3-oxoacyl-[acyl-carrier-protein] synthase II